MDNGTAQAPPDPLQTAEAWLAAGHGVALATVVSTWGSAPRPAGSMLAVRDDGLFEGSVSGGCVEGDVIVSAQDAIADGQCRQVTFGVTDADAWQHGLACGGQIRLLIEPVRDDADGGLAL